MCAQEAAQPAVHSGGGYLCALWGPGTAGCHPRSQVQVQVSRHCAAVSCQPQGEPFNWHPSVFAMYARM